MLTLLRAGLLAVAGGLLGLAVNALRAEGLALTRTVLPDTAAEASTCVAPEQIAIVSVDEARHMHRDSEVRFADVRDERAYAEGHIAGAWHLPCRASAPAYLRQLGGARTIVLYGADASEDVVWVAESLRKTGFADVRVMRGSFAEWRDTGGAAEGGSCEACDG